MVCTPTLSPVLPALQQSGRQQSAWPSPPCDGMHANSPPEPARNAMVLVLALAVLGRDLFIFLYNIFYNVFELWDPPSSLRRLASPAGWGFKYNITGYICTWCSIEWQRHFVFCTHYSLVVINAQIIQEKKDFVFMNVVVTIVYALCNLYHAFYQLCCHVFYYDMLYNLQ
jgi:hypothetical protein